jgi:small subunit ribosomal protein S16
MSVKIRLSRKGSKKRPFYHIVVANSRAPRDGDFIEKVGTYNPMLAREDAKRITLVSDRIKYWLSIGAQPTDKVARFLGDAGLTEKYTINDKQTKKPLPKAKAQERLKQQEEKRLAEEEAKRQAEAEAQAQFEADNKPAEDAPATEETPAS